MRALRSPTRPPGKGPTATTEPQHLDETVARPSCALKVVRFHVLSQKQSRRQWLHRKCRFSTASSALEHHIDGRLPSPGPLRRQSFPSHRVCEYVLAGRSEHRSRLDAEQTLAVQATCSPSATASLRSSTRRHAKRRSPSSPCQLRLATSSFSAAIDFTGYRKSASTCPISMRMIVQFPAGFTP